MQFLVCMDNPVWFSLNVKVCAPIKRSEVVWAAVKSFKIHQGVRQGGIDSTDFYKIYQNQLLNRIHHSGLGARVGNVTCNISGCADDLAVNVNSRREGQVLVNASTDHANLERYLLQVDKSVMVTVTPRDSNNVINTTEPITMNGKEMKTVELAMHHRYSSHNHNLQNIKLNIEENLKKKPEE